VLVTRFSVGAGKQRWRTLGQVNTKLAMIASLTAGLT
jgi:hypothetical protein